MRALLFLVHKKIPRRRGGDVNQDGHFITGQRVIWVFTFVFRYGTIWKRRGAHPSGAEKDKAVDSNILVFQRSGLVRLIWLGTLFSSAAVDHFALLRQCGSGCSYGGDAAPPIHKGTKNLITLPGGVPGNAF